MNLLDVPEKIITAVIAICVVALVGVAYYAGYNSASTKAALAAEKLAEESALARAAQESTYRQREAELVQRAEAAAAVAQRSIENVKKDRDRVAAELAAGRVRYTIPATCPGTLPGVTTGASQPATAARAELSVGAAQFLDGLAARADEAVIERNQCVALLEQERAE